MNSRISFFKKIDFSNFWVKNGLLLLVISIVTNHLTQPEHFPFNESYTFPWLGVTISFFLGSIIVAVTYFNFNYFKKKYFVEKINFQILSRFLLTTIGYISVVYVIIFYVVNGNVFRDVYYLLVGLFITILITVIAIVGFYAKNIYQLYRFTSIEGKLKVVYGGKITLVNYNEIAFAYSENKIAFVVKTDGSSVPTDFTLNEIEEKINEHSFYRANRQTILHASAIEEVQSIENGKLTVVLKPTLSGDKTRELTISRYKKQEFMNWLEKKS